METCYVPVCTTNLQIPTVICCIHHHIHHMSRTPFLILNFLDFDVYVVMTPIFPAKKRRCASSSKNVAILSLWSKRAIIAPNNLIDSHHYKQTSQKDKNDRIPFTHTFHYQKSATFCAREVFGTRFQIIKMAA